MTSSIAVPRSLTGCGISHIGEVSRSDGGAGNSISSVGLCRAFNPLALWALPLYSLTGTQGERLRCISLSPLLRFYVQYPVMLPDTVEGERDTQCWYYTFSPVFCNAKYRGETEETLVSEERG